MPSSLFKKKVKKRTNWFMLVFCMGFNCFLLIVMPLVLLSETGDDETIDKQGADKLLAALKR